MIKKVDFYDGVVLNLSGVMARKTYTDRCRFLERCKATNVRKLWTFDESKPITHTECVDRAQQLVQMAKSVEGVEAVWIRPMKSAPFFYTYVEDAFLTNGISVVMPVEEYDATITGEHKFRVDGWWVVTPFTEEELGES